MKEVPAKGGICGPAIKTRYIFGTLASIGMGIIYGLKVGLHVSIVSMVNHTAVGASAHSQAHVSQCSFGANASAGPRHEDGPFAWSNTVQGSLLSSYFWGYIVAQLPGGRVAELFSAKWVMLFAVAINVVAVALSPIVATLHYGGLVALRVVQGIGGGVTFPACHVLLAHWAPPLERSVMSNLVYAGTALGTVVFMLLSGVIAGALGWEAVFYIEAGVSSIWLLFWYVLVQDTPAQQPYISLEERTYIESSLNKGAADPHAARSPHKMPWRAALTSPAFLAILVAHTCSNWGWYTVLIELPQYMKNVLEFPISENGVLTAMPFLAMWVFSMVLSKVLDTLRAKGRIGTTFARKFATLCACVVPTICFVALCFVECDRVAAVALMTLAVTGIGGMFSGFLANHIDIAPNHAGTLIAITNTAATVPGIVVPVVVGALTDEDPSIASWRVVFYITIILYLVEIVVYGIFGSGEVQAWNEPSRELTEDLPLRQDEK